MLFLIIENLDKLLQISLWSDILIIQYNVIQEINQQIFISNCTHRQHNYKFNNQCKCGIINGQILLLLENYLSIPIYALTSFFIAKITYNVIHKITYVPQNINNFTNKYDLMNGKQITASIATLYMFTNQLRGVVYWNGLHSQKLFGLEMTTYDPYFIMPLLFGIVNYGLIKTSQFKSLQTIQKDQNQFKLINLCFMSSLAVVGLPIDILMIYSIMGCCQTLIQYKEQKIIQKLLKDSQIWI